MAVYKSFFKAGLRPSSYLSDGYPDDPNYDLGGLLELWDLRSVSRKGESFTATMSNGLRLELRGSGFRYEDGEFTAGTIRELRVLAKDNKTLLSQTTELKVNAPDFFSKAATTYYTETVYDDQGNSSAEVVFDGYGIAAWLRRGSDTLTGSDGAEFLNSGLGDDTIKGGGGDDYLSPGSGRDTIDGGSGFDQLIYGTYNVEDAEGGLRLDAEKGTVVDPWGDTDRFTGIEGFRGSIFADVMTGSGRNETFIGDNGRDTIDGKGGTDGVRYDRGTNFSVKERPGVTVDLKKGTATDNYGQKDTLRNIENVYGSSNNDRITGSDGANVIGGGYGDDTLTGGKGRDLFLFDRSSESGAADRITDFSGDAFQLDNDFYFLSLPTTGSGAARRLADKAFLAAPSDFANDPSWFLTQSTRIVYVKETGDLYYDRDGSGSAYGAVKFADLDGSPTLKALDFLVI